MRHLLSLLHALLLLFALNSHAAEAHDHSFGTHGMVLFGGKEGLYASHLPLFRQPHDRQIVLAVRLADPALDRQVRAALEGRRALWTIEPERFELSRLEPGSPAPLQGFSADIFDGHFEREGKRVRVQAQFVVERVLVHRRLDPSVGVRKEARYFPVSRFLVKEIDSRPDFDHIVALSSPLSSGVTVPRSGLDNPETALGRLASVEGTVYFETDDLR